MTAVLDCDDVFEVLTRAPFPAGNDSDVGVEHHLAACHECRQLAEALRPALDLVHESLAEESLPRYGGSLVALAEQGVTPVAIRRSGWAMFASGLAVCLCLWLAHRAGDRFNEPPRQTTSMELRAMPDEAGRQAILALGLPPACLGASREIARFVLPKPGDSLVGLLDDKDREFLCCTRCHAEGGPVVSSQRAVLVAVKACATCHAPRIAEVKA